MTRTRSSANKQLCGDDSESQVDRLAETCSAYYDKQRELKQRKNAIMLPNGQLEEIDKDENGEEQPTSIEKDGMSGQPIDMDRLDESLKAILEKVLEDELDPDEAAELMLDKGIIPRLTLDEIDNISSSDLKLVPNERLHRALLERIVELIDQELLNDEESFDDPDRQFMYLNHGSYDFNGESYRVERAFLMLSQFCRYGASYDIRKSAEAEIKRHFTNVDPLKWRFYLRDFLSSPDLDPEFLRWLINNADPIEIRANVYDYDENDFYSTASEQVQIMVLNRYIELLDHYLLSHRLKKENYSDVIDYAKSLLDEEEIEEIKTLTTHESVIKILDRLKTKLKRYKIAAERKIIQIVRRKGSTLAEGENILGGALYEVDQRDLALTLQACEEERP